MVVLSEEEWLAKGCSLISGSRSVSYTFAKRPTVPSASKEPDPSKDELKSEDKPGQDLTKGTTAKEPPTKQEIPKSGCTKNSSS